MNILVTGATGFVGRHVINQLVKYDHRILVAGRSVTSEKIFPRKNITVVEFDLDNIDLRKNYFIELGSPDILIHLAWQGLPNYKEAFHNDKNLPSHATFLNNIISNGLKDLIVTGTCFEYGMKEGCLSEDMETDPQNAYAIAKDNLRKYLEELNMQTPFTMKWIRLFYMYGEGQNPNSLLSQLEKALQNGDTTFNMSAGEQLRDYLPIEKVAEYIVKIALQNNMDGIINCCSGTPMKVKALVENYLKQRNKSIQLNYGYYPYNDYEPMAFWGDHTKLKRVIN